MPVTDVEPIVTRRLGLPESWTLKTYVDNGGYAALRKALSMAPGAIKDDVLNASLLGRGGAGFDAGKKWSMLAKGQPSYLVVNADESEPCTFKDHMLLEGDPHQLIEGTIICAYANGVTQAFIYVRGEFALGIERLTAAVNEAYDHGALGRDIFGSGFDLDLVVHYGAGAYIVGEETALLESLEGKRGFPRIKPPNFPAVAGLYGCPTVVNNVETLSYLPWIVLNGGSSFSRMGEGVSAGTRLFSLSGHVNRPGNYEFEWAKATFRDLIEHPRLGGGVRNGNKLKAIIPGGASSPWFGPDKLDMELQHDVVQKAGSMLGSGSVIVMDYTTCAVRAAWRIVKFFHRESCGQCTPCREGSGWLEKIMIRIEQGSGREEDLELLLDVCDNISPDITWPPKQTTICVLGPSIPPAISTSLDMFRDEYLVHIKEGGCPFD
ncbi:MAG TPA: NADH-quinone oxidoreductase subunit NuoF [Acidimicrobiales bacterium]|nr:NADH-quinone oxidoreductase subunit NuoF [Acidimicrobiales bacterium]